MFIATVYIDIHFDYSLVRQQNDIPQYLTISILTDLNTVYCFMKTSTTHLLNKLITTERFTMNNTYYR